MEDFESIKKIVKNLLETEPETRNSDKFLIFCVLKQFTNLNIDFKEFSKCPSFESLRRTRQKLFEEFPELRADDYISNLRNERKEEFESYFGHRNEILDLNQKQSRGIEVKTIIKDKGRVIF